MGNRVGLGKIGFPFPFWMTRVLPLLLPCMLIGCWVSYSVGWKYPELIEREVRLKEDSEICSTDGHTFPQSGYVMLEPKVPATFKFTPAAEVAAGETAEIKDIICSIEKPGLRSCLVCEYETLGTMHRFYSGGVDEMSFATGNRDKARQRRVISR